MMVGQFAICIFQFINPPRKPFILTSHQMQHPSFDLCEFAISTLDTTIELITTSALQHRRKNATHQRGVAQNTQ
jgi:hypothetical protein